MICSSAISPSPPFSDVSLRLQCIITCLRAGLSSVGFLVRPLRGRREGEIQGAPSHCLPDSVPLKPRQGSCPWTPLLKNLYLKALPGRVPLSATPLAANARYV